MNIVLTITLVLFVFLVVNGGFIWLVLRKRKDDKGDQGVLMLQQQLQELNKTIDTKIGESTRQMHETMRTQLGESAKIVREVTEGLTKLDETNKQVINEHHTEQLPGPSKRSLHAEPREPSSAGKHRKDARSAGF